MAVRASQAAKLEDEAVAEGTAGNPTLQLQGQEGEQEERASQRHHPTNRQLLRTDKGLLGNSCAYRLQCMHAAAPRAKVTVHAIFEEKGCAMEVT
jgi:hypothetical protein